jgi:hypothetical protein
MSLTLYDPVPENTMIKLRFVALVVDMRCTPFNVRAPITTLVSDSGQQLRTSLTLASLLLARIVGPYKASTQGTRVRAAPCFDLVSEVSSYGVIAATYKSSQQT